MSAIPGTNVAAPIVPFTTDDTYATHLDKYGQGGWRGVNTTGDMNAIPADRRVDGMSVFVRANGWVYLYNQSTNSFVQFTNFNGFLSTLVFNTWAELAGYAAANPTVTITPNSGARVLNDGASTHVDPVTGATVNNNGVYGYQATAPVGWKRLANLEATDAAAYAATAQDWSTQAQGFVTTAMTALASVLGHIAVVVDAVDEGGRIVRGGFVHKSSGAKILWFDGNWDLRGLRNGGDILATLADIPTTAALLNHLNLVVNQVDEGGRITRFALVHRQSGAKVLWIDENWALRLLRNTTSTDGNQVATLADIPPNALSTWSADEGVMAGGKKGKWDYFGVRSSDGRFAVSGLYNESDPGVLAVELATSGSIRIMQPSQRPESSMHNEVVLKKNTAGVLAPIWELESIYACVRKGRTFEANRAQMLLGAGRSGLVLAASAGSTGNNIDDGLAGGSGFIGGSAHGYEGGVAMQPSGTSSDPYVFLDGKKWAVGTSLTPRCREFQIVWLSEMFVPRVGTVPYFSGGAALPYCRVRYELYGNATSMWMTMTIAWLRQFTGSMYDGLWCHSSDFTDEIYDGFGYGTPPGGAAAAGGNFAPHFIMPEAYQAMTPYDVLKVRTLGGARRVQYFNAAGRGAILTTGELEIYGPGNYLKGPRLQAGIDNLFTRSIESNLAPSGYNKLYNETGGYAVTADGVNTYRFDQGTSTRRTFELKFFPG